MNQSTMLIVFLGLGLACICLLLIPFPRATTFLALCAYAAPLLWITSGIDTRPLAIVLTATLFLSRSQHPAWALRTRGFHRYVPVAIISSTSLLWTVDVSRTVLVAASWISLCLFAIAVSRVLSATQLARELENASFLLVMASALAVIFVPGQAIRGARWQGLFDNPNGLGVLLILTFPLVLYRYKRLRIPLVLLWLVILIGTGSRAALLAISVQSALMLTIKFSPVWRVFWAALSLLFGGLFGPFLVDRVTSSTDSVILRTNDSRTEFWSATLDIFYNDPWAGIGAGALDLIGGNSYLKLLAELGIVGALALTPLLWFLVTTSLYRTKWGPVLAGGLVSAMFESWLLSAGSYYSVTMFLAAIILSHRIEGGTGGAKDPMVSGETDTTVHGIAEHSARFRN